jgi:hypothetical protein
MWSMHVLVFYLLSRLVLSDSCSPMSGSSPNVSCSRLVSAKNLNRARSVFVDVSILVTSMFLPPVLARNVCLAAWCAGQCSSRCCTVSSFCEHAGQIGEFTFPIRNRCLARGACPVLSCARMLANFLGRLVIRSIYLWDGVEGSVLLILLYHFEASQPF